MRDFFGRIVKKDNKGQKTGKFICSSEVSSKLQSSLKCWTVVDAATATIKRYLKGLYVTVLVI